MFKQENERKDPKDYPSWSLAETNFHRRIVSHIDFHGRFRSDYFDGFGILNMEGENKLLFTICIFVGVIDAVSSVYDN